MPDDKLPGEQEPEEEDDYERRFKELEFKAKAIRDKTQIPEPPHVEITRPQMEPNPAKPGLPAHLGRSMGLALAIGYSFVGPLLAGIIIGILLDGKPGGTWTIVGLFLGTIIAFVLLIRLVNKLNQNGK